MEYEANIGLEVHVQLSTESKIFCGCSTTFGAEPNSHGCPVCLGMPGVLPVLNRKVVEYALKLAVALGCQIQPRSRFLRKSYFYPDLPKNYQISQYQSQSEMPFAIGGHIDIEINGKSKVIRLVRIHMEEDAGKLVHDEEYVSEGSSFFDVNRCGVPLIEIVSYPDMAFPQEAYVYLARLKQVLEYLDISDCNMEEGNIRIDTNISLRPKGSAELGTKTEIKNMNSFRNLQRALEAETLRQTEILRQNDKVMHQTLLWDAPRGVTVPMRSKEFSEDYRYFPEPDLVPVEVSKEWVDQIREEIPELPLERMDRFTGQYGIRDYDAEVLTSTPELGDYYESVVKTGADPKKTSNWVMGDVLKVLNERKIKADEFNVKPERLSELIKMVEVGTINLKIAKAVFEEMAESGKGPEEIVKRKGLTQITDDSQIGRIIDKVIAANDSEVQRYREGQTKLLAFFIGQVMRETKGKADPQLVNQFLRQKLEE